METIIVEIELGISGERYEFMLPAHVPIAAILEDIIGKLERYQPSVLIDKRAPMLLLPQTGRIVSLENTLAQEGLRDGGKLRLI